MEFKTKSGKKVVFKDISIESPEIAGIIVDLDKMYVKRLWLTGDVGGETGGLTQADPPSTWRHMGHTNKRRWGKSELYFCPVNKIVWQYDRNGKIHKFIDMPTYGLSRKKMEKYEKK